MQDFNLNNGFPVIETEEKLIWQQVDLLFDSTPGQLHGDIDYGTDYEYFLFELNQSPDDLKYKMTRDIGQLNLFGYYPQVSVSLYKGTQHDIAMIQVDLVRGDRTISKTYKIE